MSVSALVGLWLAAVSSAAPTAVEVIPPYKTEKAWTFFRNQGNCTAGAAQPAGSEILMMAYDAERKAFSISFTNSRATDLKDGDQRTMDIRLHRPGGVLDDGWEGVGFAVFIMPDGRAMFVSQLMDIPAVRDFGEMEAVVFIDRGKTAGSFHMRDPKFAVKELIRCALEARIKA